MSRMTSGGNVAHERVVDLPLNTILDDGAAGCNRLRRWFVVVNVVCLFVALIQFQLCSTMFEEPKNNING